MKFFIVDFRFEKNFIETFHSLVKSHFKGYLKPPFDTEGRKIAGFSEEVIIISYFLINNLFSFISIVQSGICLWLSQTKH